MFDTFRMVLMNYREVVYLVFALGAIWGAAVVIGIRMYVSEVKYEHKTKTNKES